jgi:hypothetical protein
VAGWSLLAAALWAGSIPLALFAVLVGMYLDRRAAIALTALLYGGLILGGGLIGPIGLLPPTIGTIGRTLPTFVVENLGWHVLIGQGLNAHDVTLLAAEGLALVSLLAWSRRRL